MWKMEKVTGKLRIGSENRDENGKVSIQTGGKWQKWMETNVKMSRIMVFVEPNFTVTATLNDGNPPEPTVADGCSLGNTRSASDGWHGWENPWFFREFLTQCPSLM